MEAQSIIQSLRALCRFKDKDSLLYRLLFHASWIVFGLCVTLHAWVSEDAYITLRVLDNFFNGYGLRWNVHERVQAYTHPLWLLLHIPLNAVLSNLFLTNVILSVVCTTGAAYITLITARKPLFIIFTCFLLPLFASKAFRDYSSSGLENPLIYVLFAAFGYVVLHKYDHPKFWLYISLIVALSLATRLDIIVFYAPALMWLVWTRFSDINWKHIILGAVPLVLWFGFSLFYYGFLFPNTKYAKLDTGIAMFRYIRHGISYATYTILVDSATTVAVFSSLIFIVLGMRRHFPTLHSRTMFALSIALGQYWYVMYIIGIGGDYMVGRFWAYPAFVGVWLVYVFIPDHFNRKILWATIPIYLIIGAPFSTSAIWRKHCIVDCMYDPHPMIDARYMFSGNIFITKLSPLTFNTEAHHKFVNWTIPLVKKAPGHVEPAHYIGMLGYYSGPGNIFVDEMALSDPLVARLPVTLDGGFYTGHFKRKIPVGYIEALKTGSTEQMDSYLAMYYDKLRLITSGELTDPERLKTIIEFNLGAYDHWKQAYLACNIW